MPRLYPFHIHVEKNPAIAEKWRKFAENGIPVDLLSEAEAPQPTPDDGEELYQSARRCLADKDMEGAAMF